MSGEDHRCIMLTGLDRGKLSQLFGPKVIWRGIQAAMRGNRQGKLEGDGFQLPGAFVIDTRGVIRFRIATRMPQTMCRIQQLYGSSAATGSTQ